MVRVYQTGYDDMAGRANHLVGLMAGEQVVVTADFDYRAVLDRDRSVINDLGGIAAGYPANYLSASDNGGAHDYLVTGLATRCTFWNLGSDALMLLLA